MRIAVLLTAVGAWMLSGASCRPLLDNTSDPAAKPTTLTLLIQSPSSNATVGQGASVPITWTAYNATGQTATIDVYVESRTDLTQTTVADDISLTAGSLTQTSYWDTTGLPGGEYVVYAAITAGADTQTQKAAGRITIDEFPAFEFTEPAEDATYTHGSDALKISWSASDPEGTGTVTVGLDSDSDPENGNELFIYEGTITADESESSFDWDGQDLLSEDVAPGVYNLFALVGDAVNPERPVQAGRQITVVEGAPDETSVTLGILEPPYPATPENPEPPKDHEFLAGTTMTIKYGVNKQVDALIDLKIDTDDVHTNGNELTIRAQWLVPADTESETFTWDGSLASGGDAPDGIYRLFIMANTGSATPEYGDDGEGLIYRRSYEKQPLIALEKPAHMTTLQAGQTLLIKWRCVDDEGTATIRITIDDDPHPTGDPDDPDPADTLPEIDTLVTDRACSSVEVEKTYMYQVPASLGPGVYYVFAYIRDPEAAGQEHYSVAPAPFVIRDPTR